MTKTLIWDAPADADGATIYEVYDSQRLLVTALDCSLSREFSPGIHSITVIAANESGKSEHSEALVFTVRGKPGKPGKPRFK